MIKSYRFRLYPNKSQRELMAQTFGNCRFVYNYYLDKRIKYYEETKETFGFYQCCKDLTELKKKYEWLQISDKWALQNTLKDLDFAFKNFFRNNGYGYPRFKSKKTHRYSYKTTFTNNNIKWSKSAIRLPKLGWVKVRDKQIPQGRILNATVKHEPSGKYYCCICCTDVEISQLPKTGLNIGMDLGLKEFAVTNDGTKINNPKHLDKSLKKLVKLQRELDRKTRNSNRWNKQRIKVARMYERITNQRKDFLQKLSTQIISDYDIVCLEKLDIQEMIERADFSRSIFDVSWNMFVRMLGYKAEWYGKKVVRVDRWYASSQICSCCGHVYKKTKSLLVREWTCLKCKTHHDRDVNAAKNILKEGLRIA